MSLEVSAYAAVGTPHKDIALLVELSYKTLLKYYKKELDLGKAKANATAAKTLFQLATRNGGNLGALCFWLKTQAGWRETSVVQSQTLDKNGNPITPAQTFGVSFENGGPGQTTQLEGSGVEVSGRAIEETHEEAEETEG